MEPKVIIQILEKAKAYINRKDDYEGLCHAIRYAFEDYYINCECIVGIVGIIPEFTRENAILHANAFEVNYYCSAYWWKASDIDNRIKFLNWLIEIYKNKL